MRESLRICLFPLLLPNLICLASCGQVTSGDDGGSGSDSSVSIASATGGATTTTSSTVTTTVSVTTSLGNATCPSRTANYITHTLPQQCLRTDRVAANTTQSSSSTGASSANATATADDASSASSTGSGPDSATPSSNGTDASVSTAASDAEISSTTSSSTADAESETDSPLDNANFLSFEEWKKQNLAKSGQSPENVGQGRNIEGIRERPINNALESYGDEGEIDLDFSGFGTGPSAPRSSSRQSQTGTTTANVPAGELAPALRSKDAGKTCKERTNYASFDCAANVLKSNPECKSSSSVLVENKDSYMLNTCSAQNKFFIVELCDDILIDTIVLANYEFFSSMFRHFRVSVSDRYPVKMEKWKDLGTFEARNMRDVQAFLVERPQIWARYLRIEFLSHYGSEYYCPVSLLRVHGTTMLEDYRHQEEVSSGHHAEEATLEDEATATPAMAQEPSASTDESAKATLTSIESSSVPQIVATSKNSTSSEAPVATNSSQAIDTAPTSAPNATFLPFELQTAMGNESTCAPETSSNLTTSTGSSEEGVSTSFTRAQSPSDASTTTLPGSTLAGHDTHDAASTPIDGTSDKPHNATQHTSYANDTSATSSSSHTIVDDNSNEAASNTSADSSSSSASSTGSSMPPSSSSSTTSPTTSSETIRQQSSTSTLAAPPQPATQESFYKSMHKRLQQLESNSTLSLQYIESQSRILRDAFSKVEKRQLNATSAFLSNVNATVMGELRGFREAYDQLWQSTVIELEGQREQYQREMLAMGGRLTLVADELVWQKRMGIVQSTLLLLCLGLVLFARQGNGYGGLEMPLMQQVVHRSQTALARAGWESPLDVDAESPLSRSPVSLFRRKLWRSQTEPSGVGGGSGDVTDATDSRPESKDGPELAARGQGGGGVEFAVVPPTPPAGDTSTVHANGYAGVDGVLDDEDDEDAEFEDVWESRSGPATPRGTRETGREGSGEFDFGEGAGDGVGWLDPGASGGGGGGEG